MQRVVKHKSTKDMIKTVQASNPVVSPAELPELTPNSTLADLPTYNYRVDIDILGQKVAQCFQENPQVPGVIVTELDRAIGAISRRKFFELMSRPYSLELYSRRPLRVMLEAIEIDDLRLLSNCSIEQAVRRALHRPPALLYEPIAVIDTEDESIGLLELHLLLLAQSQISARVNAMINQQKEKIHQYADNLRQEQARVNEYNHKLEQEQQQVERRNRTLQIQSVKLAKQKQKIIDLNERFIRLGHLLSTEGKKTFTNMEHSVEEICRCTTQIVAIAKGLSAQLENVNDATESIDRVSQQVRHLSIQAALITSRTHDEEGGIQLAGFSKIAKEISTLGRQALEATESVNRIASCLRLQIQELTDTARKSEGVARGLVENSQNTHNALNEFEKLLGEQENPEVEEPLST